MRFALLVGCALAVAVRAEEIPFNDHWMFTREGAPTQMVTLPHTAHVEALVTGREAPQWQGICWYRKAFDLPRSASNKVVGLRFEGAMNEAEVWVNDISVGKFMGGYLPYVMDITAAAHAGASNFVAVRLDNRDNPITGPKPLADLDFNLYSGLYRGATLVVQDQAHITDPISGGGVFVTYPAVSEDEATIRIQTGVTNAPANYFVKNTLFDANGQEAASTLNGEIKLSHPKLWSPSNPYLYGLRTELRVGGATVDTQMTRLGIRRLTMDKDGLTINRRRTVLRGANRHQEYPYIGNALPDDAQYRDARKIKEAGFDLIRLSHYPQSPAFLDACDELGLVVIDSILGWQYFNKDPRFAAEKFQECRELIRRDRNHPCVLAWEVSLNETAMPKKFVERAQAIAHEEYPGDQCFTCGWQPGYDVFLQARQHGGCRGVTNRPCLISEYGDWEYYAQNAGFAQEQWKDLKPADRSSRQLRGDGEARLLQQALNFQEAHNDNRDTTAFGDCIWAMFDYNRGYADCVESSGVMDIFRLPKYGYWFFRTQRDADESVAGRPQGPVLFIANEWTEQSPLDIRVYSDCDEVALYLNGQLLARRRPDASRLTTHLRHPPFTFHASQFQAGTLRAVGYLGGREATNAERRTPGEPAQLTLQFDLSGRPFAEHARDTIFCYANVADRNGASIPSETAPIFFGASGAARLVGGNPVAAEAGLGAILLDTETAHPDAVVYALALVPLRGQTRILSAASRPDGRAPADFIVRCTTDGSEPTAASPIYSAPIPSNPHLRAALFVDGKIAVSADPTTHAVSTGDKITHTAAISSLSQP
ncbi:MAG TPA: glycoside hydrolase family 2 TIM barrel-domain containing protein [Verrucomicrobiae bacterium]|jgi:beta-galactosidase|nr:glycoside hydrolase family 2 TIM barrel-domain containing protein [Verrucomicrobiae bacterium]